eukprot:CAMPEP_0113614750 /NCGR_PEP_ID=MMETSP0017_2-20120614/7336_1 /TAXON_ID=2856 /ORGANISM="Cylindrotheca closterium" /LENGTH=213 /DNA_ID=CAMNT_0000523945 /DNA_START=106 /DNA_END=748 /DNA_ORIENTATION=+ /assembly_acc=CAM_ASM_000147
MVLKNRRLMLSEDEAKAVIRPLLHFLSKKHDKGFYVGDMATEDIFLYGGNIGGNIFDGRRVRAGILKKMRRIPKNGLVRVGETEDLLSHLPPEIFEGYDAKQLDIWVLVVLLFELLTGEKLYRIPSPYDLSFQYFIWAGGLTNVTPNAQHLLQQPMLRDVAFLEETYVRKMSPELKELFENTLCVEASQRWGVDQVLNSEWLNNNASSSVRSV